MRALDREFDPISIYPSATENRLELHIHGDKPRKDRFTFLSVNEARRLAYSLLAEAETLESDGDTFHKASQLGAVRMSS